MALQNKMIENLTKYQLWLKTYILSMRDIRNAGVLVFVIIVLLISWSGIKAIQTNYGLQKQISQLQQEDQVQQLQNQNLQLQNQYYGTDQYLEVAARQNFGLGSPGEKELLVPESVAMKYTVAEPGSNTDKSGVPKQPVWQHNFQAWMDFFLHRQNNES